MTRDAACADPVEAMLPAAAALAVAVYDYDPDSVAEVLTALNVDNLRALAIALAANVDLNRPLTTDPETVMKTMLTEKEELARRALALTAEMFEVPVAAILSPSRRREHADARAVAMYVCRIGRLSSVATGAFFGRDHSTVLHAWGRVGESARLRGLAMRVATQCGWERDLEEAS